MTSTLFDGDLVYETELVSLHHARAETILPGVATESVDLLVTDPPYGQSWSSDRRAVRIEELDNDGAADRDTIREVLSECVRCLGQHRHLYVFGPADAVEGLQISEPATLVWDKGAMSGGDLTSPWGRSHEPISFAVSLKRHGGKVGQPSGAARLRKGSVIRANKRTGRTIRHPTEKPVALLTELIESSSRAGDLILDPFAGIGSTGVAALLRGRRALLVESDVRWIPEAIRRLTIAEEFVRATTDI